MTDNHTIFRVMTGSHLYGLQTAKSDIDYGLVLVEPRRQLFGHSPARHSLKQLTSEEQDESRHWLRDFANLCQKGNPNAIEWLWAPSSMVHEVHPLFAEHVLANTDAFVGLKGLRGSHFGFAAAQISKMKDTSGKVGRKRREYVEKYGYDIKYFAHAIRLMLQLMEIASTGRMTYPIQVADREMLLKIKNGKVPEGEIDELYLHYKGECEHVVAANPAGLPEEPDRERVDTALIAFFESYYYGGTNANNSPCNRGTQGAGLSS